MKLLKFLLSFACTAVALAALDAQASANSMVRFHLSYGLTSFGDIDVELFDTDKPLTVANFLANVQNGIYDNSIVHDLHPRFALQGGVGAVPNPFSSAPFDLLTRIPTHAPVPNEFGVGTRYSNVFGTLAMAKNTNDTNSASTSWFFNLGNNGDGFGVTNLDASLGGYTVFGRVAKGSNVLAFLNTFSVDLGIQDMTDPFHVNFCSPLYLYPDGINVAFDSLPVGFYGMDCVRFSDLFNVRVTMISGPDVVPPKLTIALTADSSVVGDVITISGTASDNVDVQSVRVYLNTNAPVLATGTEAWSIQLNNVPPGTNVVVVEAIDPSGNRAQVARRFFHSVPMPIHVQQIGSGTITGPTDGQLLEINRGYKLVAKPAAGYLFAGWTGTIHQASLTLPFLMETNLTLTAVFLPNPFPAVKGTYNGLFYDNAAASQDSSGSLTLTVGTLGSYSAKISMNGRTYRFSGHFGLDGGETNLIARKDMSYLLIRMALDLTGASDHITGSITNNQIIAIDPNAGWSAVIGGDRAVFNAARNPAPLAGSYTVAIPADPSSLTGPAGDSFGRVLVNSSGHITLLGTLGDGTKAVQRASLSKGGAWPLYLSLYKGKGALISWVMFDTNQLTTDLSGLVNWFKQPAPTDLYYPAGFTNEAVLIGSRYSLPSNGQVLQITDALVGFASGNLAADFSNVGTLTDNQFVNGSANSLVLSIQESTGLFSGTVMPPGATVSSAFRGVVLQKQNRGCGSMLGTSLTSEVILQVP